MERSSSYQTRQGELILDYLASLGGDHITAAGIAGHFEGGNPPIGKTTVYRHLEKLVAAGKLRRYFLGEGDSACYQYIENPAGCGGHFHLKCETCGELFHLDCGVLGGIAVHVRKKHHFTLNPLKTVFYGTCGRCRKDGGKSSLRSG
ncbi:MAG: transcriptional repressor [Treponema sp.]|jgi:Fur family ferric uptake transcriptional regulator|nr:transcriptional repressor [Treponema sp.]